MVFNGKPKTCDWFSSSQLCHDAMIWKAGRCQEKPGSWFLRYTFVLMVIYGYITDTYCFMETLSCLILQPRIFHSKSLFVTGKSPCFMVDPHWTCWDWVRARSPVTSAPASRRYAAGWTKPFHVAAVSGWFLLIWWSTKKIQKILFVLLVDWSSF